jgi:hypothetical protein
MLQDWRIWLAVQLMQRRDWPKQIRTLPLLVRAFPLGSSAALLCKRNLSAVNARCWLRVHSPCTLSVFLSRLLNSTGDPSSGVLRARISPWNNTTLLLIEQHNIAVDRTTQFVDMGSIQASCYMVKSSFIHHFLLRHRWSYVASLTYKVYCIWHFFVHMP